MKRTASVTVTASRRMIRREKIMEDRHICIVCETWESGGIEGFLCNVLLHMDRRGLRIDIVAVKLLESVFTEPLTEAGVRFIELSGDLYRLCANYRLFRQLLREEKYDVVHLNAFQGMSLNYLKLAAEEGVPVRIAHSHNTALRRSSTRGIKLLIHTACKRLFVKYPTEYWACSARAAQFLFPPHIKSSRRFQIIKNGVDIERFRRNQTEREQVRSSLGIKKGQLVIGHVGRLCYQKNQSFLIDIFAEIKKRCAGCVLLLVGDGKDKQTLETQVERLGLQGQAIFYGTTDQIEKLFWAMDVFVFPSHFEGFGIVLMEAQAAGLPVICSDRIPEEARFLPSTVAMPLESGTEKWAEQILHIPKNIPDQAEYIRKAGFSVSDAACRIRECYVQ